MSTWFMDDPHPEIILFLQLRIHGMTYLIIHQSAITSELVVLQNLEKFAVHIYTILNVNVNFFSISECRLVTQTG